MTPSLLPPLATRPAKPLSESRPPIPETRAAVRTVTAGTVVSAGAMPVPVDIAVHEDVAVPMRDGIALYGDIYLPATAAGKLPAILIYTPYSKRGGYWNLNFNATKFGVPAGDLTGLQPFESLDPGDWCAHGYAIVVVDSRGTSHSGGDFRFMGSGVGEDLFDTIEWIAAQGWCSGAVGMAGNSQLAMAQWQAAAANPPHLAAIAPWEGLLDVYREVTMRGGMPDIAFHERDIMSFLHGTNQVEDVAEMARRHPLMSPYWQDKRPELGNVQAAAYVAASWSNPIHTRGTLAAFDELPSDRKWMRIHDTQEWIDIADPASVADLRRFFDRFLKGERNGWEQTPRVRYSILDPGGKDVVDIAAPAWPLPDVATIEFQLDANDRSLRMQAAGGAGTAVYDATSKSDAARFSFVADREMTLFGAMNLHLTIETDAGDDLDVFAAVYKENAQGKRLHHITLRAPGAQAFVRSLERDGKLPAAVSYTGPVGRLRASHRALDAAKSTALVPVHRHADEQRVAAGTPVDLQIGLWPTAMRLHAGERLVLEIGGHPVGPLAMVMPGESGLPGGDIDMPTRNAGRHTIRTGPGADSRLLVSVLE